MHDKIPILIVYTPTIKMLGNNVVGGLTIKYSMSMAIHTPSYNQSINLFIPGKSSKKYQKMLAIGNWYNCRNLSMCQKM